MEEKTMGCQAIYDFNLAFSGLIYGPTATPCCESVLSPDFRMSLGKTGKETIEDYIKMREQAICEFSGKESAHTITKGCENCYQYRLNNWEQLRSDYIHYLDLTMYPGLCQCKCIYCGLPTKDVNQFSKPEVQRAYEILMDALNYAKSIGIITSDTLHHIATGEITMYPYKDEIFEIIGNNKTRFATNCFKFDKRIAQNLSENPKSSINLSIDAGTRKTWNTVKRVDNFDVVLKNLKKYKEYTVNDDQITIKYIVLPGLNDNLDDYYNLVKIMSKLKVKELFVARDFSMRYGIPDDFKTRLIQSTAVLTSILKMNGLTYILQLFSSEEEKLIEELTKRIMNDDKIITGLTR